MRSSLLLFALFAITIFLGSLLLFLVQPIIGKYILPWFGGTSFVWITSLLFFQTLLLAGYFYTYVLSRWSIKRQVIIHTLVTVGISAAIIYLFTTRTAPIIPGLTERLPESISPVLQVLGLLTISVGLPYFLLSTNSTLLQKWFSAFPHKKSPYELYALSNAGSLLAILLYPFLIEPNFALPDQGLYWSALFLGFCLFLFGCNLFVLLKAKQSKTIPLKTKAAAQITKKSYFLWFSLPAISSLVLLAATSKLTQAIAPIPFLWLLPLGLYLLSFIVCFREKSGYSRRKIAYGFFILFPVILALLLQPLVLKVSFELSLYSVFLFLCFLLCHGELYRSKPAPAALQNFYLWISFGSVIGSLFVAIIGPLFFKGLSWEFYISIFATAFIGGFILIYEKKSAIRSLLENKLGMTERERFTFVCVLLAGLFAVFSLTSYIQQKNNVLGIWRNFYGTILITEKETENGPFRCMLNGKIIHGCQFTDERLSKKPITYYGAQSGLTLAINVLRKRARERDDNLRIGVIGMGIGTMAAYGEKNDLIKFYELNPQDVELAHEHFTYLKDSQATIRTAIGDGRLVLEKELQAKNPGRFDLLAIDAFNDDAIPTHLLTKEAFEIYQKHLSSNQGVIIVHISTSYVDLVPVVLHAAKALDMQIAIIEANPTATGATLAPSRWAILSKDKTLFKDAAIARASKKIDAAEKQKGQLWTDEYSNLVQLLNF